MSATVGGRGEGDIDTRGHAQGSTLLVVSATVGGRGEGDIDTRGHVQGSTVLVVSATVGGPGERDRINTRGQGIKRVCIMKLEALCTKASAIFRPPPLYIPTARLSELAP